MSETISDFIYGSPLDVDEVPRDLVVRLRELIEAQPVRDWRLPAVPSWHHPYDQGTDYYWFGMEVSGSSNGYSSVPSVPDGMSLQVQGAFDALPEEYRTILPAPAFLVLTRID